MDSFVVRPSSLVGSVVIYKTKRVAKTEVFQQKDSRRSGEHAQAALDAQKELDQSGEVAPRPKGSLYRHGLTLDKLRPGECGTVQKLLGSTQGRLRLLEMGMTLGTHVKVIRIAPFGGPMDVLLRGYQLSLRRDEAACIWLDDDDAVDIPD